jgi:hypothetical protein
MYVCVGGEVTGVRNRCTIPICFKKEVSLVAECYNELVIKLLAPIEDAWYASLIVFVSLKHNWCLKTRLKNAFFG